MNLRPILSTLLVGCLLFTGGAVHSQELYFGDDDEMSPEEYYLEGIGYGSDDYGSGDVEDSSYSGLYSPSDDDGVYGLYDSSESDSEPSYSGYALPSSPVTGGNAGDSADWFSMSGVALLEAVGTEETGRILITKDASGEIVLLKAGDSKPGAFKVLDIGDEQARIEPTSGGPAKVVPILHKSAPMDAFLAAVAKLNNLRLVIGKPLNQDISFSEEMLQVETGFAPLLANANMFLKRFDDVLVVRGSALLEAQAYRPAGLPEGDSLDLGFFRGNGDEIIEIIGQGLPNGTKGGPDSMPQGTTVMLGATPAAEALHYLNLAWDTKIEIDAPKVAPQAKRGLTGAQQAKLYSNALILARRGDMKGAGKRLLKLCKSGSKNPAHFQALGKCYWKLGRIRPAVKAWKAGYKLDPSNATSRQLLTKAKRKIQAIKASRS